MVVGTSVHRTSVFGLARLNANGSLDTTFEMSAKTGRHFWRRPDVPLEAEDWDRLPGRFGRSHH